MGKMKTGWQFQQTNTIGAKEDGTSHSALFELSKRLTLKVKQLLDENTVRSHLPVSSGGRAHGNWRDVMREAEPKCSELRVPWRRALTAGVAAADDVGGAVAAGFAD